MAEGYVVYDPVQKLYYQGDTMIAEEYDNVTLWTPWLLTAKVWKTRKDAEWYCPRGCDNTHGCKVLKVVVE